MLKPNMPSEEAINAALARSAASFQPLLKHLRNARPVVAPRKAAQSRT